MRRSLTLLVSIPALAHADDLSDATEARVVKVVSGEEVVVQVGGKRATVRVMGINCTSKSRPAAAALVERQTIVLRSDKGFLPILQDQKGRYVAYVQTTDGGDFGAEMLKTGHCSAADWALPHPRTHEYASLTH